MYFFLTRYAMQPGTLCDALGSTFGKGTPRIRTQETNKKTRNGEGKRIATCTWLETQ